MKKYAGSERPKALRCSTSDNVGGLCSSWCLVDNKTKKMLPDCGEILLVKSHLGMQIVAHEVSHAMFSLKRRKSVKDLYIGKDGKFVVEGEEWAVSAVGNMTNQVYHNLFKKGVI